MEVDEDEEMMVTNNNLDTDTVEGVAGVAEDDKVKAKEKEKESEEASTSRPDFTKDGVRTLARMRRVDFYPPVPTFTLQVFNVSLLPNNSRYK